MLREGIKRLPQVSARAIRVMQRLAQAERTCTKSLFDAKVILLLLGRKHFGN
jgi:hypothetical protein